jgi:hypothetical protein
MKRYFCISLIVISVLLTFAMPCHADHYYRSGGPPPYTHHHGGDWDWVTAVGLGLFGMGLFMEMTRPQYPPQPVIERQPEMYMQPVPQQQTEPAYWYYCKDSNGYYPYVKRCPGGWLKVVPIPAPPSRY